ncbi:MAG: hypothetical protein PVSMB4_05590 [Ktedonobacterales bacterium]
MDIDACEGITLMDIDGIIADVRWLVLLLLILVCTVSLVPRPGSATMPIAPSLTAPGHLYAPCGGVFLPC